MVSIAEERDLDIPRISRLGGGRGRLFWRRDAYIRLQVQAILAPLPKLQGGQIFSRNFAFYK